MNNYITVDPEICGVKTGLCRFVVLLDGGYNTGMIGNACYRFIQGAEWKL